MAAELTPVIVVGGGWAGLSCAVELSRLGHPVTVLEAAKQLGGRARRVPFNALTVDNGQHVMLGAYQYTLALLQQLKVPIETALHRDRLTLHLQDCRGKSWQLQLPHLLTPLNLFVGLLRARGFSLRDRWQALRFGLRLFTSSFSLDDDTSVAELLVSQRQTRNLITALWEPICLASLNTPIEEASARVFIRVLHDSFCKSHRDADMIIPRLDLGSLLPDPAFDFIEQQGGFVHLSQRVTSLTIRERHIEGVVCENNRYQATQVVLAIPPYANQTLIKDHPALHDIAYNLSGFSYHPICTIYLQYPASVQTDRPMQGLLGGTVQWIFDRRIHGQAGLIAAVISGPGAHMQLSNDELVHQVQAELHECFPHWPAAENVLIIREKRATFSCRSGIDAIRPDNASPIKGLWFAGDFTNTGYPATIESAIISGTQTAQRIHHESTA